MVRADTACQFGKWLHSLPPAEQNAADCRNIMALHAQFHETAAQILDLALKGKQREAMSMLEYGGVYSHVSGKLVLALNAWKEKLR